MFVNTYKSPDMHGRCKHPSFQPTTFGRMFSYEKDCMLFVGSPIRETYLDVGLSMEEGQIVTFPRK